MKIMTPMSAMMNCNQRFAKRTIRSRRLAKLMAVAAFPALMVFPGVAHSATVVFNLDEYYTAGSIAPTPTPTTWLRLTITDTDTDEVSMKFEALGLIGQEYVESWYLNFGDAVSKENLTGSLVFGPGTVTGTGDGMTVPVDDTPQLVIGLNDQNAGGNLNFDITLSFATSNQEGLRFTDGDILTYTVTYDRVSGDESIFNANSFDIGSSNGTFGPYATVAHVNGIPDPGDSNNPTGSAWVAATPIPEPSAGLLGMIAAAAYTIFARRRRDSSN